MKGQINLEFLSAAMVYLLALGSLMTIGSGALPNFSNNIDQASLNMEAKQLTERVMTHTGYTESYGGIEDWHENKTTLAGVSGFGLANSSDEFMVLDRDKIQKLKSFPRNNQYFNYSQFKNITGAENQYKFNFTWKPVVETYRSYNRGDFHTGNGIGYWKLDGVSGNVKDQWNNHHGQPRPPGSGPTRGVAGVDSTNAFRFDASNDEYVITNDDVLIPDRYSIFTWIKGLESQQESGWNIYSGGFNDKVLLGVQYFDGTPRTGILIRNAADDGWHQVWSTSSSHELLDGDWHHYGAAVNRDTGTVKIYLDGKLIKQDTIPDHFSGSRKVIIGSMNPGGFHFTGKLDEFRIYDRALSDREVKKLYEEPVQPNILPPKNSYYNTSANIVHFGNQTLNGDSYRFLVTSHDGRYNTTYVSKDWNFSFSDPLGMHDSFKLHDENFTVDRIQNQGSQPGSVVVLGQHLNTFGPHVDSDSTVIKLDRYAIMDGEPLRIEVLAW